MKLYILVLVFFFTSEFTYAQYTEVEVILKNQEKLSGQGRFTEKIFKFKNSSVDKVRKIEYQKIDYVKVIKDSGNNKGEIVIYKSLPLKNQAGYFPVEQIYNGDNVQLYFSALNYSQPKNMYGSRASSSGFGFGFGGASFVISNGFYYAKRSFEDILTPLSRKSLKKRVKIYFSNCPSLLEKIDDKSYNVKKDLKEIFTVYDENCG